MIDKTSAECLAYLVLSDIRDYIKANPQKYAEFLENYQHIQTQQQEQHSQKKKRRSKKL